MAPEASHRSPRATCLRLSQPWDSFLEETRKFSCDLPSELPSSWEKKAIKMSALWNRMQSTPPSGDFGTPITRLAQPLNGLVMSPRHPGSSARGVVGFGEANQRFAVATVTLVNTQRFTSIPDGDVGVSPMSTPSGFGGGAGGRQPGVSDLAGPVAWFRGPETWLCSRGYLARLSSRNQGTSRARL
jgi:hypothetical protein